MAQSSSSGEGGGVGSGKHREMDALRRRKETGLIRQLEQLTARDREKRKGVRSALIRRDQGRLAVLHDSVDLISRLEDLNAALTSACNAQEERMQAMAQQLQLAIHSAAGTITTDTATAASTPPEGERKAQPPLPHSKSAATLTIPLTRTHRASSTSSSTSSLSSLPSPSSPSSSSATHPLSLLPSRVSDVLSYFSSRHSLYSSLLGDSRITTLLVDSSTGIGLDANDAYFHHSHFTRHQLTHTLITAPYRFIMGEDQGGEGGARGAVLTEQQPPAKKRRGGGGRGSGGVLGAGVGDEVAQGVPQWPRSLREMRRLYDGEVGMVHCVWRCRMADGLVREQQWVSWVAKRDSVVDDHGNVVQRPVHTVYAAGFDDAVVIEDWSRLGE